MRTHVYFCIIALFHKLCEHIPKRKGFQDSLLIFMCTTGYNECMLNFAYFTTHQTHTPLKSQNITQRLAPLQSFDLNTTFMRAFPCFHLNKDETSSKFHVLFTEDSYILRKISS